jgi:hypothetical protein
MGKQYNKVIKNRRRLAHIKRKAAAKTKTPKPAAVAA